MSLPGKSGRPKWHPKTSKTPIKRVFSSTGTCSLKTEGRDKSISDDMDEFLSLSLPTGFSQQDDCCDLSPDACISQHTRNHECEVKKSTDLLHQQSFNGVSTKTELPQVQFDPGIPSRQKEGAAINPPYCALNQTEDFLAQREQETKKLRKEIKRLKDAQEQSESEQYQHKAEWETEKQDWKQKEDELMKKYDSMRKQLEDLTESNQQLKMRTKTFAKMEKSNNDRQSKIESLERKIEGLNKEILNNQLQHHASTQSREGAFLHLQDENAKLQQEITSVNEELRTTQHELQSRIRQNRGTAQELTLTRRDNKRMSDTLAELRSKVATLKDELDTANLKIKSKAKREFDMDQKLKSFRDRDSEVAHLLTEYQAFQEQYSLLKAQLQSNQADFEQERADRTAAAARYITEREEFARNVKDLKSRLRKKDEEARMYKETNARLTRQVNLKGLEKRSDHRPTDRHGNGDEETALRLATLESERDHLLETQQRQQKDYERQHILMSRQIRDSQAREEALSQKVADLERELQVSKTAAAAATAAATRVPHAPVVARSPYLPNKEVPVRQVPGGAVEADIVEKDGRHLLDMSAVRPSRGVDTCYSTNGSKRPQKSPLSMSPALANKFDESNEYRKGLDLSVSLPRPMHEMGKSPVPERRDPVPLDNPYSQTQFVSEGQHLEEDKHRIPQVHKSLSSESDSSFQPNQQYIGDDINREIRNEAKDYRKLVERGLPACDSIDESAWPFDPNLECKYCGMQFRQGQIREFRYHVDDQHSPSMR